MRVPSAERGVLVGPGGCGKPPALPQRNGGFVGAKDIPFGHLEERRSPPLELLIPAMPTVAELREKLRQCNLSTTGKKDELMRRWADHEAEAQGGSAPSSQPTPPASPSAPETPSSAGIPTLLLGEQALSPPSLDGIAPSCLISLMHRSQAAAALTLEEKNKREQHRQYNEKVYLERRQGLGSPGRQVRRTITKFKLIKMFEEVDEDGNGTLERDEVRSVLCKIKDSDTVPDGELALVMNELNPSGTGQVTWDEFMDYFERHRGTGAGIIGKYFTRKAEKKEEPTFWQRVDTHARDSATWIVNWGELPFKVVSVSAGVLLYWSLVTNHVYEDAIAQRTMLLPISWFNANSSIEMVQGGFEEMAASVAKCKSNSFDSPPVSDCPVLKELETHADIYMNRVKCLDHMFQHTMSISQSTGVLSVQATQTDDQVLWVSPAFALSGLGIVECSVLIGILQVFLFVMLLRLVEHICARAYSTAVGTELWSKLRDAHFEKACKGMFDQLDMNHDGHVSRTELRTAFARRRTHASEEEIDEIIKCADTNNNDSIEYPEFRQLWYATRGNGVLPELRKAFTAFDTDENGFASITEFREIMQKLDEPYTCKPTDEDLQAMTEVADVNMDGQVDYEEFEKMMLKSPSNDERWYRPAIGILRWLHPKLRVCKSSFIWLWILFNATSPIMWLEKLIGICSEFEKESDSVGDDFNMLLRTMIGSSCRNAYDFSCEYRTFGFKIAALAKWVVVDMYEGVSGVGIFGAICGLPTAYQMWNEHQIDLAKEKKQQHEDEATLQRDFMEVVQFSLCKLQRDRFTHTTMFEMDLKTLVKGKKAVLKAINEAAAKTTKQCALLHTLQKDDWQQVRGMLLNTLSEKYSDGYVAEELGIAAQKAKFWFCLTNEATGTTKKLRVIVAKDELLQVVQQHLDAGTQPTVDSRFKSRWDTVKYMAQLLRERRQWKNSPMRDIELALPFSMTDDHHGTTNV